MKRIFRTSLLILFSFVIAPFSAILASPIERPPADTEFSFAPGSVVRFEHLTSEDGLSQNAGLDILQDSRGYLWFGTQDGLNRYDGYSFKIYKHDPEDPTSISHNSILELAESDDGTLWIGTWGGGLNRYDPVSETFTRYQHDPDDSASLADDNIYSILEDSNGNLWIGTLAGLDRLDPGTSTFEHFAYDPNNPNSLSSNAISLIFEDSKRQLWIATGANGIEGSGLNRFDPATGHVVRYQHDESDPQSLASNNIADIYEAEDGTFWVATGGFSLHGNGLDHFDPNTGKAEHYQFNANDPHSLGTNDLIDLWGDSTGMLWIGTWSNGLNGMNLSNPGYFTRYVNDPFFQDSLSGNEVWSLFKDRSGILWIGTSHNGINKLSPNIGQFSLYQNNPSDSRTLGINAIGAFAEDPRGDIWVATWGGGLDRFNPGTGEFVHFRHDPENPNSLSDDLFMDVYVDEYGIVWAGTLGRGLNRLNPATSRVTHYLHDAQNTNSLPDDNIAALLPDRQGGLWIGTFGGLSHYDPNTNSFTNYSNDPENPSSISHNMVVSLSIDSKDNLWIGTWGGGLNQLDLNDPHHTDPTLATFTHYRNLPDNASGLNDDAVWAIHETADGILWLGTQLGLNQFDPVNKTFKHFTEKQGLPNNTVLGILSDDNGNLWITTNNGLAKFDPQTEKFIVFDSSDGLQSNEFNSNAYYRTSDGTMYIGGISGFNKFDPEAIEPNPVPPQVVVTHFEVFNEPLFVDLSGRAPIRLDYKQDFITFEFAAFDFQAPQKNQYAYKLEGFNEDWIQAGNRRYATYTSLPGGEYIFRVKAANSDGTWNERGVAIPIIITPPAWQSWWFISGLIVLLAGVVAGAFRLRLNTVREQNVHLETLVSDRTSALRETNTLLEKEVEQRKRAESELEKRAAEDLRESEARFRAMFENSAIGIGIMNLNREVLDMNPAMSRMLGYSREELLGESPARVTYPEDMPFSIQQFQDLVAGRIDHYVTERRYVRKDGKVFWAQVSMSMVRHADGSPNYLVGLIADIDAQKQAQAKLAEQEAEYLLTLQQRVHERTLELQEANKQLQKEIEQRVKIEEELAQKAADEAVAADRTRLARDLHDAVTQTLFSASLTAEVLPELWDMDVQEAKKSTEELRQLTRGALAEMRTLLLELRPSTLTQTRLGDLIRQLCEALIGRSRLPITLNIQGDCQLPPEVQVAIYRIAQESLNNVFKYARATQVDVNLYISETTVNFVTCDNGIGFDMSTAKPTSLGLRIMRERAEAIGAEFQITSAPGEGTCVELTWTRNPNLKLKVL